jgi:toxin ParE1/3/4
MSKNIRITRSAQRDLDEIWFFIARDSLVAAEGLIGDLTDRFSLLASFPQMGRSREDLGPELRSFPVKNYLVIYRSGDGRVEIVRVVHTARDLKALFK